MFAEDIGGGGQWSLVAESACEPGDNETLCWLAPERGRRIYLVTGGEIFTLTMTSRGFSQHYTGQQK